LLEISRGDVRRLENVMQACAALGNKLTEDQVFTTASVAKPKELKGMLENAVGGKFLPARDSLLKIMLNYGLSGLDIVKQIQSEIWKMDVDDKKKLKLVAACGECEFRMVEGSDEFVQLEALLAQFSL
jgi:replication factor C small subunit